MTDGVDDRELADDVVGVASARLRAHGLAPERRRRALRVLGVLGAVADAEQRVRRPLSDVAGEFGISVDTAAAALDDLVDVGVARHDAGAIVLGGAEPAAHGAIRLQDFLALAEELEHRRARRRSPAILRPAAALLAVAALIAVVLLAPGTTGNRTAPVSSTGGGAPATTATDRTSISSPLDRRPAASTVTTAADDGTPAPTVPVPPSPCPTDLPLLEILDARPDVEGNLSVNGLARNLTGHDLTIESFTVGATVAGRQVRTPSAGSLLVPANSSVPWEVTVPVLGTPASEVQAMLGDWQWRSPTCSGP